jgi:hypothetical protein
VEGQREWETLKLGTVSSNSQVIVRVNRADKKVIRAQIAAKLTHGEVRWETPVDDMNTE